MSNAHEPGRAGGDQSSPQYRVLRWAGTPTRQVNSTLFLGPPVLGNATPEELTWPVVSLPRRVNSTLVLGPPVLGNASLAELTWPIIDTGSEIISAMPDDLLSMAGESDVQHITHEVTGVLDRTPVPERAALLHRLQELLAALAAERPAA